MARKEKIWGCNKRNFITGGGRKGIVLLDGSQETSARPSVKVRIRVKMFEWQVVKTELLFSQSQSSCTQYVNLSPHLKKYKSSG